MTKGRIVAAQNAEQVMLTSQICCGLSDSAVSLLVGRCRRVSFKSNETIFTQGEVGESLFIFLEGRGKLTVNDYSQENRFIDFVDAGEHTGEMAVLSDQIRNMTLTAVMDSDLLELKREDFQELIIEIPGFAANISRALSFQLRRETSHRPTRYIERIIGVINHSRTTQKAANKLAAALALEGEPVNLITDDVQLSKQIVGDSVELSEFPRELNRTHRADWMRKQLAKQSGHQGHTVVSLSNKTIQEFSDVLTELLMQFDQILWFCEPELCSNAKTRLEYFLDRESRLADIISWGWVIPDGFKPEDLPASPQCIGPCNFKITVSEGNTPSRLERMGMSHLVRHIRKTRLGLALGGGAARGMAHLGVLKEFEREGIFFDMIAGTSAGALVGVPYAYGLTPDWLAESFAEDVRPGWFLKLLPKGKEWYMLKQYRLGKWDGLLRQHVGTATLEQLITPTYTITADLITGRQVIRSQGDATHAILESINLPFIAKPIFRDGMALVDGGILNNVPSDILPERGADIVLGVDIATQISQKFGKNVPGLELHQMRKASQMQTIMRATEIQSYEITSIRTRTVDQMIVVDTSAFDFADFTKAPEMAEAGQLAAQKAMPQFRELLKKQQQSQATAANQRFVCQPCEEKKFSAES